MGFHTSVGKPIDEHALAQALANTGTAVAAGDTVQITSIDFRPREIQIDINGGSQGHFHLRDHLQVGVGGMPDNQHGHSVELTATGRYHFARLWQDRAGYEPGRFEARSFALSRFQQAESRLR